ncbi:hypothetical protein SERLA73DRAFT_137470, partial [Serpula lacrymans var. lacrymans S7.3]
MTLNASPAVVTAIPDRPNFSLDLPNENSLEKVQRFLRWRMGHDIDPASELTSVTPPLTRLSSDTPSPDWPLGTPRLPPGDIPLPLTQQPSFFPIILPQPLVLVS